MTCFPHDEEEEDEDETETEQPEEQEGTEEHKSVILHILSQLRIGMDLTKVWEASLSIVCTCVCLSV